MKVKSASDIAKLGTEAPNAAAAELDTLSALDIARIINAEDAKVAPAVARALPEIARAIDAIASALGRGGRLIYVGAGTSGRIAALDASECPPTFNTSPKQVQFVIAGGAKALSAAAEYNEDSRAAGRRDLAKKKPAKRDVVVGIAASGRTLYTVAALEFARKRGATTVAVTCNRGSDLERVADIAIVAEVGAEVLAGSTRMKAGTAQKMICNLLTTGAMARLGYVYGNLMVNVHTKNQKLRARGVAILERATGADRATAARVLKRAGGRVPVALVMLAAKVDRREAERRLRDANGHVRLALKSNSLRV
jgi:N-acetylmuramic acid 6-phosphate etherase